jgi:tRNA pseudouridine38-40 synthase
MSTTEVPSSATAQRIALAVEYDGTTYSGWQKQASPELPTVQSAIDTAISQVADAEIASTCAGRTDAGVHATCQVIHFDSPVDRGDKAWTAGVNSLLPDSIRIIWSKSVENEFHARFSAMARQYNYVIYVNKVSSANLSKKVTHVRRALDYEAMELAAQELLGERDFSAFRAAGCQSKSSFRNVEHAHVRLQGPFVVLDIKANAFLQHMVRNIAGALMEVGHGKKSPAWIAELLAAKDRSLAGVTAPADGLYLVAVDYPQKFELPESRQFPLFLPAAVG